MSIQRYEAGPRMSRVVVHNGTVYLSGMTADDTSLDFRGQTKALLAKIDRYLDQAGTDKSKLLQATIWLPDIDDFDAMNEIWDAWVVPGSAPARATVESRLAGDEYRIEIMVTAAL